ncbi:MAG TPA: amidase [Stellaceae bacterium]|nr:amidase [Stellaceae bacterium]
MTELPFRSAVELASEIKAKRIGCRELLELYLKRVERYNPQLNAIIVTDLEGARKRADAADAALVKGESWGPLHGVPMTVKESYDVVGLPTTWGAPEFKDFKPARNAVAVDRLLGAGAVIFGKTNVPYMLGDFQSYNVIYGTTNNPWDVTRSPGGSSGGAAAALAAGLTGLEAGSDIGSSLRNPAHYCGIYTLKPTFGVICTEGHRSPGRISAADISVIGPLARSAADLEVATSVMAGPDATDGLAWRIELPKPTQERLADFRVAVMLEVPHAPVDRTVQDGIQGVADALAKAGAKISDSARPAIDTAEIDQLFRALFTAAMAGRQRDDIFKENLEKARALAPDDMSSAARSLRAVTMHHRDWIVANEKRHHMRLKWAEFFRDYDVLICPPVATPALLHDHEGAPFQRKILVNGKPTLVGDQLFWAGYAGLSYLPAAVAPAGQSPDGLPVGVQIIAGQYRDLTCLRLSRLLEREYRGFVPPPGYTAS